MASHIFWIFNLCSVSFIYSTWCTCAVPYHMISYRCMMMWFFLLLACFFAPCYLFGKIVLKQICTGEGIIHFQFITKHNNHGNGTISAFEKWIPIILTSICSYWDHLFLYDKKAYIVSDCTLFRRREREDKSNNKKKKWIIIIIIT